ncbi:alpha-ribazole phosphatase/probable phosphoglycerate mutase [Laceyella tengchongensis]|uniref:Alpha-ribazole phosphatase/probable phosphoglycerate mutase n=1 Tax=Laceyella tengchongensis TaxID=574699 RepID=A0AA46AET8_9BACL|nr:histidine phosphatase family protein [Laceyella tengchongensis]SMP14623.1 alpha-ribazole phosphatase/probable phosphoglycerate mutase [Laceyella tengchongensis]
METHVFLVRHGVTEWNQTKRYQGQQNVPLSELGRQQAERVASYLADQPFAAIYSSDLERAHETARCIAAKQGISVTCFSEFRERYGGEWEGRTVEEVLREYTDWETVRLTGGVYGVEPTIAVQERFVRKCEELVRKHRGERILIVAHGMCITAALGVLTQGEIDFGKTRLDNTAISHLTHHELDGWKLRSFNQTPHLEAE